MGIVDRIGRERQVNIFKYSQVILLRCNVVQGNSSNKNAYGSQKVNYKDELQEFPRTPYRLKKLSNEKETNCAGNHLQNKCDHVH